MLTAEFAKLNQGAVNLDALTAAGAANAAQMSASTANAHDFSDSIAAVADAVGSAKDQVEAGQNATISLSDAMETARSSTADSAAAYIQLAGDVDTALAALNAARTASQELGGQLAALRVEVVENGGATAATATATREATANDQQLNETITTLGSVISQARAQLTEMAASLNLEAEASRTANEALASSSPALGTMKSDYLGVIAVQTIFNSLTSAGGQLFTPYAGALQSVQDGLMTLMLTHNQYAAVAVVAATAVLGLTNAFLGESISIRNLSAESDISQNLIQGFTYQLQASTGDATLGARAIAQYALNMAQAKDAIAAGTPVNAAFANAISAIGLNINALLQMNPDQAFLTIEDALAKTGVAGDAAGQAMLIFGRFIATAIPSILQGSSSTVRRRRSSASRVRRFPFVKMRIR